IGRSNFSRLTERTEQVPALPPFTAEGERNATGGNSGGCCDGSDGVRRGQDELGVSNNSGLGGVISLCGGRDADCLADPDGGAHDAGSGPDDCRSGEDDSGSRPNDAN